MKNLKNFMVISICFGFLTLSCENSKINGLEESISFLEKKNDSLLKIVKSIEKKYVFDSIAIHEKPFKTNTNKINSIYNSDIFVVGYGLNNLEFVQCDSIKYNPLKIYNPNKLKHSRGMYKLSKRLTKDNTKIKVRMVLKSDHGKSKKSILDMSIKTKN